MAEHDDVVAIAMVGQRVSRRACPSPAPFCGHALTPHALDEKIWAHLEGDGDDDEAFLSQALDCPHCRVRLAVALASIQTIREGLGLAQVLNACPHIRAWHTGITPALSVLAEVVVSVALGVIAIRRVRGCGGHGMIPALAVRDDATPVQTSKGAFFNVRFQEADVRLELRPAEGRCELRVVFSPEAPRRCRLTLLSSDQEMLELIDPVPSHSVLADLRPGEFWLELRGAPDEAQRIHLVIGEDLTPCLQAGEQS